MANSPDHASAPSLTEAAARVVGGLLGKRVLVVEQLHQGMMTFKCRVRTDGDDDVIVRFYPASRSALVYQEPDLLLRCCRAGLPVPQPIGDSRAGPSAPLSYVVYRRIEGETLADRLPAFDDARRRVLAEDLAAHLYRLQDLKFEGAGELISSVAARDASWDFFVHDAMRSGLVSIKHHSLLEWTFAGEIERVIRAGPPAPERATRRLVWGDVNFGNILVKEDGRIAGLIDFEGCLSGDPLATLGYAAAVHGPDPFFAKLRQAWPQALSDEEDDLIAWYALLRALRLARYAHLPLPTGRPRDPLIQIVPGIIPAVRRLATIC
jgi:aminoglycoside phosphotransferase (APT) family kinase protein